LKKFLVVCAAAARIETLDARGTSSESGEYTVPDIINFLLRAEANITQ
jgi:hypothetical protein